MLKSILLRTQKELSGVGGCGGGGGARSYRASFCCFENAYLIMNRILLEIRMLNILLLRSQKEMRNMLVNTRGRVMLVTKNLPELCSSVG